MDEMCFVIYSVCYNERARKPKDVSIWSIFQGPGITVLKNHMGS